MSNRPSSPVAPDVICVAASRMRRDVDGDKRPDSQQMASVPHDQPAGQCHRIAGLVFVKLVFVRLAS